MLGFTVVGQREPLPISSLPSLLIRVLTWVNGCDWRNLLNVIKITDMIYSLSHTFSTASSTFVFCHLYLIFCKKKIRYHMQQNGLLASLFQPLGQIYTVPFLMQLSCVNLTLILHIAADVLLVLSLCKCTDSPYFTWCKEATIAKSSKLFINDTDLAW